MKSSTLHIMPLIAMMGGAPSAISAPALPDLSTINAAQVAACGQHTPCCPHSTQIKRDGDFKAVQQVTGNITSNYQMQYTMQPLLKAQMGAFANYFVAAIGSGYGMTARMDTAIFEGGTGATPIPTITVGYRLDLWTAPFGGTVSSNGHGTNSVFPLVPGHWYVVSSSFNMGGMASLGCGEQKFAYRVEYKPMKVGAGTSMQPTVQIIPYTGSIPTLPAPQLPLK